MNQEEYRAAMDDVIYLVSCAVNGKKPDRERIGAMDLSCVYTAAGKHLLAAAAGMALKSAGVEDARMTEAVAKAQRKNALLDADRMALSDRLEQAGIWYMPLKGAVLKDLYPRYGMRQMADNDILIDAGRAGDVKAIMESLGFITKRFGKSHHDEYIKPPVSSFEIHRALFGTGHEKRLYEYYGDVRERLAGDGCEKHFSPEDFYLYMIAHEYKHYSEGGTGLRSVLDTYVYLKAKGGALDRAYVAGELGKLNISGFEAQNRSLALHLFGGEELTAQDEEMLEYILSSGTYGTVDRRVANRVERYGGGLRGKARYLRLRLFPSMEKIKDVYPFFYKHKILLPALFFYRIGRAGLKIRDRTVLKELKALVSRLPVL